MLKRALAMLGLGSAIAAPAALAAPDPALYERLFCDRPALYRPASAAESAPWQALLFDAAADPAALRALAEDARADSGVRALAWGRLRDLRQSVPSGELLGVVFEVEVSGGLDVLAAYADGRLRYLNHGGRVAVFETTPPALQPAWQALMAAARGASATARPWQRDPGARPAAGQVRLSFVRSDGLAMLLGPFDALQRQPSSGPLLLAGAQLVQQIGQALR